MKTIRTTLQWIGAGALLAASALSTTTWAAGTGYLFVSSEKDHAVSVLDGESYALVKQIRTAARPRHLRFTPDRSRIYVACGDGDAIDVIDVARLELVDRIGPIGDPEAFEFSPDGETLYISLEDDAQLGILNLRAYFAGREEKPELTVAEVTEGGDDDDDEEDEEGGEEDEDEEGEDDDNGAEIEGMSTVEVGEEPEGILVSPDGKTVFVTSEVANVVHVVDTASASIRANIVAGNRPRRFALIPGGDSLWVTNELSGSVSVVDLGAMQVADTIEFKPKGFRPEDVTPVGITHDQGRKDRVRRARPGQPRGGGGCRVACRGGLHPGREPGLEHHAHPGRIPPDRGERPERRHIGDRHRDPPGRQVDSGRTGALCGPHRRLRPGCAVSGPSSGPGHAPPGPSPRAGWAALSSSASPWSSPPPRLRRARQRRSW